MAEPVTVLVRRRVKLGAEAGYEAWLTRLTEGVAREFSGYLGAEFHRPTGPGAEYRIVFPFDSAAGLERVDASDFPARVTGVAGP